MLHKRPSRLLKLRKSDVELLSIDYEIMSQYFLLIEEEKTPEEKTALIRKMREEMRHGGSTRRG